MLFNMSEEIIKQLITVDDMIVSKLGVEYSLDFDSDNVIEDFFELCGLSKDRRIALEADQLWAKLIRENNDFDASRLLNQYRAKMKEAITMGLVA